jgi:hypothetical protein
MPTGSCLCGSVRYSIINEPLSKAFHPAVLALDSNIAKYPQSICHCVDCRKIGGSTYSMNLIVSDENFTLEAAMTLKYFFKPTKPGRKVQLCFCGM